MENTGVRILWSKALKLIEIWLNFPLTFLNGKNVGYRTDMLLEVKNNKYFINHHEQFLPLIYKNYFKFSKFIYYQYSLAIVSLLHTYIKFEVANFGKKILKFVELL